MPAKCVLFASHGASIAKMLNRIAITIYACAMNLFHRLRKKTGEDRDKNVLIIFQQIMGDAVILSASLDAYARLFPAEEGWSLKMICLPSIAVFLREVAPLPEHLQMETVDFKRLICDFNYFQQTVRTYGSWSSMTIVPGSSPSAELLSAALPVKRRVGLLPAVTRIKFSPLWLLQKIAYSESVRPGDNTMVLQAQRMLLRHLGAVDYHAALPRLLPQDRIVQGKYVVVCPGASVPVKCWPRERFVRVIDEITGRFDLDVHLCGGPEEQSVGQAICAEVRTPNRVVNHIGQTTFSQWSALIQHASLVLGNDSATEHLAAAARVPAICLVGRYDSGQFFPYAVDALQPEDRLPDTIVCEDMPCSLCRTKRYQYGYRNAECQKRIKASQCAMCIDAITVEEVMQHVGQLLETTPQGK